MVRDLQVLREDAVAAGGAGGPGQGGGTGVVSPALSRSHFRIEAVALALPVGVDTVCRGHQPLGDTQLL